MRTECAICSHPLPLGLGKKRQKAYCSRPCRVQARFDRERRIVARACRRCGVRFESPAGKGTPRKYCSDFCRQQSIATTFEMRSLCVVEGCLNRREYANPAVCNSCYYRHLRTGTYTKKTHRYRGLNSTGYVSIAHIQHPLANTQGRAFEHRVVLYDAIGPGPHPCHWCGTLVNWVKKVCVRGALVPDHLDGNKANNARDNLVPACNRCNCRRGLLMAWVRDHADDPVLWAMYRLAKGVA